MDRSELNGLTIEERIKSLEEENNILKRALSLHHELASHLPHLKRDEDFLRTSMKRILEESCKILDFKQGEVYLLLDKKGNIPKIGEMKDKWYEIKAIASIGFEGTSQEEDPSYKREDFKEGGTIDNVLKGHVVQLVKNKAYIKSLERLGILRKKFWREIRNLKSDEIRQAAIPATRTIKDISEVPAYANFSIPNYDIGDNELIPHRTLLLAQQVINGITDILIDYGMINELNNTLTELQQSIEEKVRLSGLAHIGILAGEISHNLGNHSTRIAQNLDMAEKYLRRNEHKKTLEKIVACIEANRSLKDLTTRFYNLGTTNSEYVLAHLNIGIENILSLDRSSGQTSFPISVLTDFDDSIGDVFLNVSNMSQVYVNILHNSNRALRLKKKKMNELHMEYNPEIKVATKKIEDKIKIIFMDNGIGISEENLKNVFDVKFTTKSQGEGVGGYGLAYCYKVMKEHNGTIEIKSKENEFTEVILTFPYKKS